ncbi:MULTISPECIES: hypothetical protein [unclassified Microbacterium]|uniref:hypothetical protein n=1 Tax=unclassified Microbacterium TaxID=2609290 RepID=UPI000C2C81B6|nr:MULTISPECIES: hypothetical protein [unclassified Microbacterium]
MTDQLTPPAPPAPPAPPTGPENGSGPVPRPAAQSTAQSAKVVAILTASLGGVIALALVGSTVISTIASASVRTETQVVDAAGVDELDIDVSAGSLRIDYADVDAASLDVTGGWGSARWTLERDEDQLVVSSPDWAFGGAWLFGGNVRATLTLPRELENRALDAQFTVSAGDLDASGRYGELDVELGAGAVNVSGAARTVSADISAGRADLDLTDVQTAELTLSAGRLDGRFDGSQPRLVEVNVSAGSLNLALPEGAYDLTSSVSAGQLDNRLDTSASASSRIAVELSAGQIILRSAD